MLNLDGALLQRQAPMPVRSVNPGFGLLELCRVKRHFRQIKVSHGHEGVAFASLAELGDEHSEMLPAQVARGIEECDSSVICDR